MAEKYALGIDFGTLSARAVLVNTANGNIAAQCSAEYEHGVMDTQLPDGTPLKKDWALQHPADYLEAMGTIICGAIEKAGVSASDIIGVALDFTACTVLPLDEKGQPLCLRADMKTEPHAYVKLWKHHAAQYEANRVTELAERRNEDFLKRYGGKISSEWMLPKIMQILDEAPHVYRETYRFVEAADYVTAQLTGNPVRNSCCAGYKGLWNKSCGYASHEFLRALDPRLEYLAEEKLCEEILPQGAIAGYVTKEAAWTGLAEGTAVAVATIDAHVAVPGVGITGPGELLMIMGTSGCDIVCDESERLIPGICGVVEDGVLPGYFGYESGQACMGDHFEWFAKNCVPGQYQREAMDRGLPIQGLLTEKAEKLLPGESGLLALDWWNGNRSVLVDGDLTGLILGMSLTTKPEEIYRALIEATAYGKRMIIENYINGGINIDRIYACGGICGKNSMMMQIYADVLNREIRVSSAEQTGAIGAAMFAACAAGSDRGGYDSIADAARAMARKPEKVYRPVPENAEVYDSLYREFVLLHDYFGRGGSSVMKIIKNISAEQRSVKQRKDG